MPKRLEPASYTPSLFDQDTEQLCQRPEAQPRNSCPPLAEPPRPQSAPVSDVAADSSSQVPLCTAPDEERFLTVKEVAKRYASSVATIWRWVHDLPSFPSPVSLSPGTTRWRLSELLAYEASLVEDS